MRKRKYDGLWARLMANSEPEFDNEQACWVFIGKCKCRFGYGRINVHVPGLGKAVKLTTHILTWLLSQPEIGGNATANELYLAYLEFRYSGLELDHGCVNTVCLRPDHLEPLTHAENMQLSVTRRRRLNEARQAAA